MTTKKFNSYEDLPKLGDCPICGSPLLRLFGSGWDWDRALCSSKECLYDKELDEMTTEEDGAFIQVYKEGDE